MKIEIFKKPKKNFRKGGFQINPDITWEFVLYIAFAVIVAFVIFGYYLFGQTDADLVSTSADSSDQIPTVKEDRIDKVLEYFSGREKKSSEILNSPSPIVDPSL
jgi:hypothetical protein